MVGEPNTLVVVGGSGGLVGRQSWWVNGSGTWRLVVGEAGTCGFATLVVGGLVAQIPWW